MSDKPGPFWKEEERYFGCQEEELMEDAIDAVRRAAEGLTGPTITYGNMVRGWVPMSDVEIARAKKRQAASKVAAAAKREKKRQQELALARRLVEKYGADALGEKP